MSENSRSDASVQVYLEPGEAIAYHAGVLVAEVLDVMHNGMPIAILDTSATCHMPDTLEMPYRAQIIGAGEPGAQPHTYRLGGQSCLAGDVIGDYSFAQPLAGRPAPGIRGHGLLHDGQDHDLQRRAPAVDRDLELDERYDQGGARLRLRGFQRKAVLRFFESEIPALKPEQARFHVVPVPYEKTVSYGNGTAKGPRRSSRPPASSSASTAPAIRAPRASTPGPRSTARGKPERVIDDIAAAVRKILKLKKIPVVLGGEHTVTWGVIKGYLDAGEKDFGVVQIDAHADLRDAYEGNKYSHASVMRRVVEAGVPLVQLGNRAYCEEERDARKKHKVLALTPSNLVPERHQHDQAAEEISRRKSSSRVDVDGIDPSVLPATGTPVPGGLGWYQTLGLFESVARQRRIIGFDVMEFAPIPGFHAFDFAAALLTYKLMGIVQRCSLRPTG